MDDVEFLYIASKKQRVLEKDYMKKSDVIRENGEVFRNGISSKLQQKWIDCDNIVRCWCVY
jgi:hypothetical protein